MTMTPTPGQVAYETVQREAYFGGGVPWTGLEPREQAAWEAAAQAVLHQAGLLVLDLAPDVHKDCVHSFIMEADGKNRCAFCGILRMQS